VNALRIATWNLGRPTESQRVRRERLTLFIRKVNADIWVLTETHSSVSPGSDFQSVVTTTSDRPAEAGEAWTAIWSRFPMSVLGALSDPARAVAARVEPPGRCPIVVYGTVLPWLGGAWREVPAAKGAAYAAALAAQARDWTTLQSDHPDCDFVLAGDMNQDLAESHFYGSRGNRAALVAAFQSSGLTCLTAGADDPVRLGGVRALATIDHLCVSDRLAQQVRWPLVAWPFGPIPTKTLTDHFGTAAGFSAA